MRGSLFQKINYFTRQILSLRKRNISNDKNDFLLEYMISSIKYLFKIDLTTCQYKLYNI